jgi:hypothetical protein
VTKAKACNFKFGANTSTRLFPPKLAGEPRSGGVVCSKLRSVRIDAREALLINRYCSPFNSS